MSAHVSYGEVEPSAHLWEQAGQLFLYIMAFFIPFSIAGEETAYAFAALVWIGLWVKKRKVPASQSGLEWPLFALAIVLLVASVFSPRPGESFFNLRKLFFIPAIYIVPAFVRTEKRLRRTVHLLLLMAALTALYGIGKHLLTHSLKVIATQSTTMTWGALSVFFVLFWVGLLVLIPERRWKMVYALGFLPQFVAQVFSYVRGSYLGLLTGLLVLAWVKSKKLILYLFVLLVIFYGLFPGSIRQRVRSITDLKVHSTRVRLTQWRDAVIILKHYPVLGVGWIDLNKIHREYAPPNADLNDDAYKIGHFHNNFVMMAMVGGVLGLAAFIWLFVQILVVLYRRYAAIPEKENFLKAIVLIAITAVSGFLVNGIFDWLFGDEEVFILLFFTIGLANSAWEIWRNRAEMRSDV